MNTPKAPKGYNTVNPFIITKDAVQVIDFLKAVFDAEEDMNSHTMDTDGLLLHAELTIGNSRVAVAETKPTWPTTPSLLQVYVDDIKTTLAKAKKQGARIVTDPTDFYGDTFSRFIDSWGNLWWVYQHNTQAADAQWDGEGSSNTTSEEAWSADGSTDVSWQSTKEMDYIHDTLLSAMESLGKK